MKLVLDASAAAAIVMQRREAADLHRQVRSAEVVRSPDLIVPELTNVFWKYRTRAHIDPERCARALSQAIRLPDELVPCIELHEEVLELATQTGHPAYDAFYLVLARRTAARLLTLDRRLATLARELRIEVV